MNALDQHDKLHKSPMPDIGGDLVARAAAMNIEILLGPIGLPFSSDIPEKGRPFGFAGEVPCAANCLLDEGGHLR